MDKKVFRVLARKEVIYAVAGAGASTAAYFVGVKRERKRILSLYAVHNLVQQTEDAQGEFDFMEKHVPYEPAVYRPDIGFTPPLDELFKKYGPHHQDVEDFERAAQPLADEILGVTDGVDPPEFTDEEIQNVVQFKPYIPEGMEHLIGPDGFPIWPDHKDPARTPEWETEEITEMESDDEGLTLHTGPERRNVFASTSSDGHWNMEEELASRNPDRPYIIHVEEFIERESGYEQSTLTYFAKDGVVADELESPLEDWVSTLGQLRFGHGCPDANAVYIRNEKLQHEFEVLLSTGAYLEEVMGHEAELEIERDEIKHSMNMRMRRE